MRITVRQLRKWHACRLQVELFAAMWGSSVEATREHCMEAAALGLDAEWLAKFVLSATALADYRMAVSKAWKIYRVVIVPAQVAYNMATNTEKVPYATAAKAQAVYNSKMIKAWTAYRVARWSALADALGL